jgi:hypothetical protein
LNNKWQKSIERYKESQEYFFTYERPNIMKKIEEKTNMTQKNFKENKEKKMQFLTEIQFKNLNSALSSKKNVENALIEDENYRLDLQEKVESKIKKISSKNKEILDGIKKDFEDRSYKSMQSFRKKYNQNRHLDEERLKANIEKPIIKYENWV